MGNKISKGVIWNTVSFMSLMWGLLVLLFLVRELVFRVDSYLALPTAISFSVMVPYLLKDIRNTVNKAWEGYIEMSRG